MLSCPGQEIYDSRQDSSKWKINHLRDIEALSVAIPYTDAVVTDADVANAAKPAGPRSAVRSWITWA
jgi:hypothetical protein